MNRELQTAADKAAAFLISTRARQGGWRDFVTLAGWSSEWVSGYIGAALAGMPDADSQRAARETWQALLGRRRWRGSGWGYNGRVPPDGDSTIAALRLAERLGEQNHKRAARAYAFLESHILPGGALTTYAGDGPIRRFTRLNRRITFDGWCGAHPCVTAAGAQLEGFSQRETLRDMLRAQQQPDGSWIGYWWAAREYTTALTARSLAGTGRSDDAERVRRAVAWAVDAAKKPEEWSAFNTAYRIMLLALAPDDSAACETLRAALRRLLDAQREDGGWDSGARMRIPPPDVTDPEAHTDWILDGRGGASIVRDRAGLFTTATALMALQTAAPVIGEDPLPQTHRKRTITLDTRSLRETVWTALLEADLLPPRDAYLAQRSLVLTEGSTLLQRLAETIGMETWVRAHRAMPGHDLRAAHSRVMGFGSSLTAFIAAPVPVDTAARESVVWLGTLANFIVSFYDYLLDHRLAGADVLSPDRLKALMRGADPAAHVDLPPLDALMLAVVGVYFRELQGLPYAGYSGEHAAIMRGLLRAIARMHEIETRTLSGGLSRLALQRKAVLPFVVMGMPAWLAVPEITPVAYTHHLRWTYRLGAFYGAIDDVIDLPGDYRTGQANQFLPVPPDYDEARLASGLAAEGRRLLAMWHADTGESAAALPSAVQDIFRVAVASWMGAS